MAGDDGEAKVVRGASLLILLQVFSRAVTFVANQLLLRFMTASLLGVATQLEVYYLSVLFFARESLRVAIQRQGPLTSDSPSPLGGKNSTLKQADGDKPNARAAQETQAVVNLGHVAIALGLGVAALLGWLYLRSISAVTLFVTPYLVPSVYIYALASVLELLSEPAFVVMQVRLQFGARASAEGVATFAKCVVTLAAAVWASRSGAELGVLPFALGQVAYGFGQLVTYTLYGAGLARKEGFSLFPRRLGRGREHVMSYFYQPTLKLASSMMVQSFVKHVLTQGDTFLVSALSTPTAQGVYALANNYGGLAARLVFQPVEESSRNYYSRLLSSDSETVSPTPSTEKETTKQDNEDSAQAGPRPSKEALAQASENLTSLLRFYTLASVPLLALGPTAAPLALSLVAGPQWTASGAGEALAAYVYYIPLLAINGLAEGFVASVATEAQVHLQSAWMTAFSVLFGVSGYVFLSVLGWGAVGLVWANGINMAGRIAWALWFIRRYFAQRGARWELMDLLPSPLSVLAAAVASQVVRRVVDSGSAGAGIKAVLGELIKVAGTAVPFVGVLAFAERRFLMQCYQAVRGSRPQAPKPQ